MQDLLFSHWCFIQMLRGFHQMVLTSIPFCIFLHLDLSCYVLRTRLYGVYLDIEIDPAIIKIIDLINFIYTPYTSSISRTIASIPNTSQKKHSPYKPPFPPNQLTQSDHSNHGTLLCTKTKKKKKKTPNSQQHRTNIGRKKSRDWNNKGFVIDRGSG